MFVGAGSRHEGGGARALPFHRAYGVQGHAPPKRPRDRRDDRNVGGDLNAEAGVERTSYFARVMGTDAELALDVIGDLLTESAFAPEELEREKNVIVQEIGSVEDTPDDLVFDLLTATAWPDQPMGARSRHTRARRGLRPGGDRLISGAATARAPPSSPPPARLNTIRSSISPSLAWGPSRGAGAGRSASRLSRRRDQGETAPRADACRRGLRGSGFERARSRRRPSLRRRCGRRHVVAALPGGARKTGPRYSIYGFHWDFIDTGLFGLYAGSADKDVAEVVAASLDCLGEAAHGLEESEIRRAKAQMKVALVTALEQPGARVHQLSRQMQIYGGRSPSTRSWPASTLSPSKTFAKPARPCLDRSPPWR